MRGGRVKIVSSDGEMNAHLYSNRQNYSFGGYMIVSMNSFLEMRRLKLSAREREVMDYLMLHIEYLNAAVGIKTGNIAIELGTSDQMVSRCLTKLERSELILRSTPGCIYLNPNYWFKGNPQQQKAAVFKWHQKKAGKVIHTA